MTERYLCNKLLLSHPFLPFYLKIYFFQTSSFSCSLEILPEDFTRLHSIYFILLKKIIFLCFFKCHHYEQHFCVQKTTVVWQHRGNMIWQHHGNFLWNTLKVSRSNSPKLIWSTVSGHWVTILSCKLNMQGV